MSCASKSSAKIIEVEIKPLVRQKYGGILIAYLKVEIECKAQEAADNLRDWIKSEKPKALPSATFLSKKLAIARVTLLNALKILQQEGIILVRRGCTTLVIENENTPITSKEKQSLSNRA